MSLIPTTYSSTDPGAPALSGTLGSMLSVLRAILVTGYGTAPNAKAGAGWTEAFTGTNKAAFRNSALTGTGSYLRVDDGATVAGSNARYALVRAYESMTAVDTGFGPGPTVAQLANGMIWPKSATLDGTSRRWFAVANERYVYLFVNLGATTTGWTIMPYFPAFAGDLVSRRPGDAYHFMLASNTFTAFTALGNVSNNFLYLQGSWSNGGTQAGYVLRNYLQALGAAGCGIASPSSGASSGVVGSSGVYPDVVASQFLYERVLVMETGQRVLRGRMPGIYQPHHDKPFADLQVLTDITGLPAGTQLLAKTFSQATESITSYPAYAGQLLFDLTNPD